nr:type IV secretion system protein VirB4 [Thalassobacillus sp. C254]
MLQAMLHKIRPKTSIPSTKDVGYNPICSRRFNTRGIRFEESYIRKGDGYEACIHVYDFQTIVSDFWLEQIMNMPNVVACLDVTTPNRKEMITNINKSMAEAKTRGYQAKDTADAIDASESFEELKDVYNEVRQGEVLKRILLRLFIYAKTADELERTAKEVINNLESMNFRGSIFLNEQEYEWDGLFKSFSSQQTYANKRKGIEIPALSLAGGYPFHFTSLDDPYGTHYGTTDTNGNVIFDLFHRDDKRKSYNALMIGKMGSGKSTLLKKVALDNAIKGHKVRILDITGEFEGLTHALDGKVIALDGTDGSINPLHVYKAATDDKGVANERISFTQHLSKLSVFYRFLNPDVSNEEIKEYENLLRKLYVSKGLWSDDENETQPITDLKATEYPVFSDFLELLQNELYTDVETQQVNDSISEHKRERLENIELNIANVVQNYADLFNTHSSIDDFDSEEFVSFPLRNLSELKPEIFQAQLFNVMNMLWDGMLSNGQPQFKAFNKHKLEFEDAIRYLILIDEAHHIINTRKVVSTAFNTFSVS